MYTIALTLLLGLFVTCASSSPSYSSLSLKELNSSTARYGNLSLEAKNTSMVYHDSLALKAINSSSNATGVGSDTSDLIAQ